MARRFSDLASVSLVILAAAIVASCAKSPEKIAPVPVDEAGYGTRTCDELSVEQARVGGELAMATAKQEQTRSNDVAGVIIFGLPLGSMSGNDVEPEIARLKGERDALDRAANTKNCGVATAAADSAGAEPIEVQIKEKGRMTEAELRSLIPGATLRGTSARGNGFVVIYNANWSLDGQTPYDSDSGAWMIEGDTICTQWRKWRNGQRRCFYVMKNGDRYVAYFTDTNELNANFMISRT